MVSFFAWRNPHFSSAYTRKCILLLVCTVNACSHVPVQLHLGLDDDFDELQNFFFFLALGISWLFKFSQADNCKTCFGTIYVLIFSQLFIIGCPFLMIHVFCQSSVTIKGAVTQLASFSQPANLDTQEVI